MPNHIHPQFWFSPSSTTRGDTNGITVGLVITTSHALRFPSRSKVVVGQAVIVHADILPSISCPMAASLTVDPWATAAAISRSPGCVASLSGVIESTACESNVPSPLMAFHRRCEQRPNVVLIINGNPSPLPPPPGRPVQPLSPASTEIRPARPG